MGSPAAPEAMKVQVPDWVTFAQLDNYVDQTVQFPMAPNQGSREVGWWLRKNLYQELWRATEYKEFLLYLIRNQRLKTDKGYLVLAGALSGGNTETKVDALLAQICNGEVLIEPRKT